MPTSVWNETFASILVLTFASILIVMNVYFFHKSRYLSHNMTVFKGRFLILIYCMFQIFIGISLNDNFYDAKNSTKRLN